MDGFLESFEKDGDSFELFLIIFVSSSKFREISV